MRYISHDPDEYLTVPMRQYPAPRSFNIWAFIGKLGLVIFVVAIVSDMAWHDGYNMAALEDVPKLYACGAVK